MIAYAYLINDISYVLFNIIDLGELRVYKHFYKRVAIFEYFYIYY